MKHTSKTTRSRQQGLVLSAVAAGIMMMYGGQAIASVTSPVIGPLLGGVAAALLFTLTT